MLLLKYPFNHFFHLLSLIPPIKISHLLSLSRSISSLSVPMLKIYHFAQELLPPYLTDNLHSPGLRPHLAARFFISSLSVTLSLPSHPCSRSLAANLHNPRCRPPSPRRRPSNLLIGSWVFLNGFQCMGFGSLIDRLG